MADAQTPENTTPDAVTPIEPSAVIPADEVSALTDDALNDALADAIDEATAAAFPDDASAFDQELAESTLARVTTLRSEIGSRKDRRDAMAAAQAAAGALAAVKPPRVPSVADLPKTTMPKVPTGGGTTFRLVVPSDAHNLIEDKPQGAEYNGFREVGTALARRHDLMAGMVGNPGRSNIYGLMQIRRDDTEFAINPHDDYETSALLLDKVRNQSRLPGGNLMASWESALKARAGGDHRRVSLTAAAGWCAPSTTLYDLCENESTDGVIDLPEITSTRGGFRWTSEPTFAQLMSATSFSNLTEAQVIANTAKSCAAIPCPTFNDTRLNVAVTCLTGSFLQLSAYPELMARWGRGALVAHAHKLNRQVIASMVTAAGAAVVFGSPAGDPATSSVLSAVELAATDIRYREGLADDHVIEVVLPQWVLAQIRADYTRRNAGRPDVSNAEIMDWFMVRGVRPQFVRDWQDFWGGVAAPSVGSGAPFITALPTTVQFLAYPAGAVVLARQDVITLSNVYDSTNLQQNLFTQLFFEEGWATIFPCAGLRLYSALTCPSGATAIQIDLDCTP